MDTKRLREIHAAGTIRPWRVGRIEERDNYSVEARCPPSDSGLTHMPVCEIYGNNWGEPTWPDAHLIVTAVNALPTLLDVIEKQSEAFEMVKWCCANEATMPNVRIKHALDTANRTLKRTKEMLDGMGEG